MGVALLVVECIMKSSKKERRKKEKVILKNLQYKGRFERGRGEEAEEEGFVKAYTQELRERQILGNNKQQKRMKARNFSRGETIQR